jgi:hypothetical protein
MRPKMRVSRDFQADARPRAINSCANIYYLDCWLVLIVGQGAGVHAAMKNALGY